MPSPNTDKASDYGDSVDWSNNKAGEIETTFLVSGNNGEAEFLAQDKVKQSLESAPHIVTYCDTFQVPGANGDRYHVLLMRLLGPNLDIPFRNRQCLTGCLRLSSYL
ncbi:hypothetical protein F4802DRAFT_543391 [Xylaria palmicola]|nr:hypothetical protein F4802DRAFT_543391 [Xylaria palmicola]